MKTNFLLILLILSFNVQPQDIIYKNDGTEIKSKVTEISDDLIKFKKFDQLNGPIRDLKVNEVFMIIYEDGQKEVFKKPNKNNDSLLIRNNIYSESGNQNTLKTDNHNKVNEDIYINSSENRLNVNKAEEYPQKQKEQKVDKYFGDKKNSYFSTAFGYGTSYGGFGIREDFRVGQKVGFGMHIGGGYFPSNGGGFLTSIGIKLFMYKGLYINFQYGLVGIEEKQIDINNGDENYQEENKYTLYGPSFLIGGDWIFGKTFGLNAAFGLTKVENSILLNIVPTLDFGIIVKY